MQSDPAAPLAASREDSPRPGLLDNLRWRGLVHQLTDPDQLSQRLSQPLVVYAGFDPTSDSLHVGSLLPLLLLRRFQRAGHRPIAVVGGATGMIGDPSGKSEERNLLDPQTLDRNVAALERQMRRFLDFDAPQNSALLLNNLDWLQNFTYLEFLRDVGKHVPINVMLAKDSIKSRLSRDDAGLSYTEFSYMLLQAYDFVYLAKTYGCLLQVGGSDQWGNITAGIDLTRRLLGIQLYGLTCPLLTKNDGTKMGKTEHGAIWLSTEKTSPYAFYQYWIDKVSDQEVGPCLRMLTELDQAEIEALEAARAARPDARESQRRLAEELTRLVHGPAGLETAQKATGILFGAEIQGVTDQQLQEIFRDVPSREFARHRLGEGLPIVEAVCQAGLAKTRSEVRRAIEQGGLYVNNRRIPSIDYMLTASDLATRTAIVLRVGKKRYGLLLFR